MPGVKRTRSFAWNKENHTKVVTTGSPDDPGIPRATVLRLISSSPW
jgi:hypothetical protein